jgi:hypothetical protein
MRTLYFYFLINQRTVAEQFLLYLFIRFAIISYGRFIAIRYKINLWTYGQEPLVVISGRGCVQTDLNEER